MGGEVLKPRLSRKRRIPLFLAVSEHEVTLKRFLTFVLFLTIVCLSVARAAAEEKTSGSDYYPLKVGSQWTYQIGSVQVTLRVAKHEKVGDVLCGVVESSVDGKVVATEHISVGDNGVFRHTFNGQKDSEPLCLLKLPVKKDQEWAFNAKSANGSMKGKFKSGEEEITVPAGTFTAVTAYTTECELNGTKAECKCWFAPGVGIVKQTMSIGGNTIVSELKKFEAGK